jgi:predicted CoA-binding protein
MAAKKTLILGASTNPERYAYKAAHKLTDAGHPIVNIGLKDGEVAGEPILPFGTNASDIDTVTLYLGPRNQEAYYDYILSLHPRRIIFNPGTENPDLKKLAENAGVECLEACTLVLLGTRQY